MQIQVRALAKGLLTYMPAVNRLALRGTGGTVSARYCYSVWLRHLVCAFRRGLASLPETVAELGPGDSLGVGLAALLAGSRSYFALDAKQHASTDRNLSVFDQLVDLYRRRAPVPDAREFPSQLPQLDSYEFPRHILSDQLLAEALQAHRLEAIRGELARGPTGAEGNNRIAYFAPWYEPSLIREASVDFLFSQAVMEHVSDLDHTYQALARWLRPGGWTSHVIDFRCHKTTRQWNGHWTCSDVAWKLIKGRRTYLINRQPHSTHVELLGRYGFQIVGDVRFRDHTGVARKQLTPRFRHLSDDDLTTYSAFLQAVKHGDGVQS